MAAFQHTPQGVSIWRPAPAPPRRLPQRNGSTFVYDDDLNSLEDTLRRLKVEYDIFFNGHRKRPPDDLRMKVEKAVKRLSEAGNMTFQQRFRYNTMVARFYVLRDLWRRTIQQREAGIERAEGEAREQATATGSPSRIVAVSISDPEHDETKVRQLYQALVELRGRLSNDGAHVSYPQFVKYIKTQTAKIREQSGCSAVVFAVSEEESAIRFTARADA